MEANFPMDQLVIGVHIRAGNGKDDGQGHFDATRRGEWINNDLPAAVAMVRKHIRMIAYSILERFGGGDYLAMHGYDPAIDGKYRIFLATDSERVLEEFRQQDPTVLSFQQDRVAEGEGVTIFRTASCENSNVTSIECALQTQESMLLDMLILSSCDALLAESFSNFMYSLPATLMMAEGRIFCESGRAALGGNYIMQDEELDKPNLLGKGGWWAHPPPDAMPVRCHQGGWAARDRYNLHVPSDVGS